MNFGAIDIGSNAARVLIMDVKEIDGKLHYNKLKLLRYPIRLGFDAFLHGKIGTKKEEKLIKMCTVFKLLMELYDVETYKTFGTSALRDSINGKEIIAKVKKEAGIEIEIISGNKEAELLYHTHFSEAIDKRKNYIYVDVGGGSTEVSLFIKGKLAESKSFRVGTVRMLQNLAGEEELKEMKKWIKSKVGRNEFWGIGSGGNINSLFGLSGMKKHQPISIRFLMQMRKEFKSKTVEELMDEYSFKQDRADVIVPALTIYKTAFAAANVKFIYVPKIGLADGIIRAIAEEQLLDGHKISYSA